MAKNKVTGWFQKSDKIICYISYAKDDILYAQALRRFLLQNNIDVISDGPNLDYDVSFSHFVREFLQAADVLIFVGSREGIRSNWLRAELEYFAQTGKKILPIIFDRSDVEYLPPVIKDIMWVYEEPEFVSGMQPSKRTGELLVSAIKSLATKGRVLKVERIVMMDEKRPLNEGKLILVGRGEVGKTSLVKRLVENKFRGDESKTQGINITSWKLSSASETYKLNIWDFGGQEIMHATHQFFLTEQSLYLLVLNGREGGEDMDAEYWLKHIESFGADSPVIVVQNKISQHPFELNYRGLQARYPQIRAFIKTDCKDKIGIEELRAAIQKAIEEMKQIRMLFPVDWFTVKKRMESMKDEYIGFEKFRELCAREGISDESDQDTLRWVLHCLGIALNYHNDSRLRETSVLKPEWVTHGIYSILNAKRLAQQQGELFLKELQNILPKNRYPLSKHLFIIELMRKFNLCFAFPDEEDKYLIPELLGKEEPEEASQFKPSDCLNFEYHYAILPEGLIPRFIVRSHILSRNQERWRSGVVLAHENCKALVIAEAAERRVIIRVKGGDVAARRDLLAIIRYDFDAIHAEFKDRLDVQAKVPLSEFPEFSIDHKKLKALEKKGVTTFPEVVGEQVIDVRVGELLNGVDLKKESDVSTDIIMRPKSVFFSYSHKDEGLRDELEVHLKLLQRQGIISTWHDRKILPGGEWDHIIDNRLERATIILLLVSSDFIASDYSWENEVQLAMKRHGSGEAKVIPILLRPCDWKGTPFGKLQGLPKDMVPVTLHTNRDAAWTEVAKGIRIVAESISVKPF